MTEKMLLAIEAALWRVLDASLKRADAMYPNRETVDSEYLLHLKSVQSIMGWHVGQMMTLRKMGLAARPRRPMPARASLDMADNFDDWDLVLDLLGLPVGESWMMSIGLSALPYDIRLLMVQMNYVMELALSDSMKCLTELQVMADALQSDRRSIGGNSLVSKSVQVKDRELIERESHALAERMKRMMQPKDVVLSSKKICC
jgi:hypothetical protein